MQTWFGRHLLRASPITATHAGRAYLVSGFVKLDFLEGLRADLSQHLLRSSPITPSHARRAYLFENVVKERDKFTRPHRQGSPA
jgi:hypothetical protein